MKTEEITAAASRWGDLVTEKVFAPRPNYIFHKRVWQARLRGLRAEGIRKSY